jgi:hypothetical protein
LTVVGDGEAVISGEVVAATSAVCVVEFGCGAGELQAANRSENNKKSAKQERELITFIVFPKIRFEIDSGS